MKTLTALAIKFIASFAAFFVVLGLIYGLSLQSIVLITIIIGVITYIGDKFILPRSNNIIATSTDYGVAFLLIWSLNFYGNVDDNYLALFWASIFGALAFSFCEYFVHIYMYKVFYPHEQKSKRGMSVINYAMETSEEISPPNEKKNE
ncbi:YndM family protein [Heyndrickxia sp. NPDC080065]|uniref:YndM family protein n=1 Tax=Heyndrickxia sp. NPDC080065 TaxID=3390568 RepID=UPI003CFDD91D